MIQKPDEVEPEEGAVTIVGSSVITYRRGFWREVCAEPQDLTTSQFFDLVKKRAGLTQWPDSLTLRIVRFNADRDRVELMRCDGKPLKGPRYAGSTMYWRTYRGDPLLNDGILQSVKQIAEAILRELSEQ
jgi:hypothetical protein